MLVAVQFPAVTVAGTPLNETVFVGNAEPKFVPVIVTAVPAVPEFGETVVILGALTIVYALPLLATPEIVTTTLPLVVPVGTVVVSAVGVQFAAVTVAVLVPNLTVFVPGVDPKFVPLIVTVAPTANVVSDKLVIVGTGGTVNRLPLLSTPLA